jgi:hypothetical protein
MNDNLAYLDNAFARSLRLLDAMHRRLSAQQRSRYGEQRGL